MSAVSGQQRRLPACRGPFPAPISAARAGQQALSTRGAAELQQLRRPTVHVEYDLLTWPMRLCHHVGGGHAGAAPGKGYDEAFVSTLDRVLCRVSFRVRYRKGWD